MLYQTEILVLNICAVVYSPIRNVANPWLKALIEAHLLLLDPMCLKFSI